MSEESAVELVEVPEIAGEEIARAVRLNEEFVDGGFFWLTSESWTIFKVSLPDGKTANVSYLMGPGPATPDCYLLAATEIVLPAPGEVFKWNCGCKCVTLVWPECVMSQTDTPLNLMEKVTKELMRATCEQMKGLADAQA